MGAHTFMLIFDGPIDEATSDLLYEAGLDDAAITASDGHPALDIDREAPTLLHAITSAVTQADIAERTGRSRQAVNHWINRDADSSGFPDPAYGTTTRSPLWRWTDVQAWLEPDAGTGVRRFQTSQWKQRVDFCLGDFKEPTARPLRSPTASRGGAILT